MSDTKQKPLGDLVIAADFGTTSVKVCVTGSDLEILGTALETYPLSLPKPNHAEQAPEDWWEALRRAVASLAKDIPDFRARVRGLVFCAQMGGLICVDAEGAPLRPCILWLDKRSADLSRELTGGFPSFEGYNLFKLARWIRLTNGAPSKNGMDPIGKMLWVQKHEPEIFAATEKLLDAKDWLIHRSTGVMTASPDSANLTWMLDSRPGKEGWSQTLADRVGIPTSKLAPVVDGADIVGNLTARAADDLGLNKTTQVIAGGSDVSATAIGAGLVEDGELLICASTSCWISGFMPKRVLSVTDQYATLSCSVGYRPMLVAVQESAASAVDWAVKALSDDGDADASDAHDFFDDMGDPDRNDPYFIPWLAGEKTPLDDERVRGSFFNLSLRSDRNALKRAVIEGVALNTQWAYSKVLKQKGVKTEGPISLVGGLALNRHFAQAMANAINRPVAVGDPRYIAVLGAAAIAAPALGWTETVWDAARKLSGRDVKIYEPDPAKVELMRERSKNLEAIRKSQVKLYGKIWQ